MANWCSTEITIRCKDEATAKSLDEKITQWAEAANPGHTVVALPDIVIASGVCDPEQVRCRGTLEYHSTFGNEVRLSTETAWLPMLRMWRMIADKYAGEDAEIEYEAVECGCEIFCTNNPDLEGKYYIDIFDKDVIWAAEKDDAKSFLQELLNISEEDFDKLVQSLGNEELGNCREWEIVPIFEWD